MRRLSIIFCLSTAMILNASASHPETFKEEKYKIPGLVIPATSTQALLDLNDMDGAVQVVLDHLRTKPDVVFSIQTPKGRHDLSETTNLDKHSKLYDILYNRRLIDRQLVEALLTLAQSTDDDRWVNFFKAVEDKELDEKILSLAGKLNNKSLSAGLPNYREHFYFRDETPWTLVEYTIDLVLRMLNPQREYELTLDSFFNGLQHYEYNYFCTPHIEGFGNVPCNFVNGFNGFIAKHRVQQILRKAKEDIWGLSEHSKSLDMYSWD